MNIRKDYRYAYVPELLFSLEGLSVKKKILLMVLGDSDYKAETDTLNYLSSLCGMTYRDVVQGLRFFVWINWVNINEYRNDTDEDVTRYYELDFKFVEKSLAIFKENNIGLKEVEFLFDYLHDNERDKLREKFSYTNLK